MKYWEFPEKHEKYWLGTNPAFFPIAISLNFNLPLINLNIMLSSSPSHPIRVMRIIARMNVGGPATHVTLLNEGLTHLGYECLLVTGMETSREGTLKDEFAARQLAMEIIPDLGREINFRQDIATLFKLYQLMREWKPDIVHTHTAKAGLVGRLAARWAGVPWVVHTFHGHVFQGYFGAAKTRFFIELEKFCAKAE